MFEKHPDVQNLFVHFRGLSSDELRSSERLRDHGLKVMNTVDKCIARLDKVDKLEKLLYELGQKHVIYNIKIEYLDVSMIGYRSLKKGVCKIVMHSIVQIDAF